MLLVFQNAPFCYFDVFHYETVVRASMNPTLATLVSQMQWRPLVEAMTTQSVLLLEVSALH